jgi:molecular chaperone HtpG
MDDAKELLPQYLRFVRGIIDSEDLPLNVSREILQQNRILASIRTASVRKILSELKNIAANQPGQYSIFIAEYNRPLKEGLYGDFANRETLLDLVRFKSTKVDGLTSLADVKSRRKEGQEEHLLPRRRRRILTPHFAPSRDLQEERSRSAHPR